MNLPAGNYNGIIVDNNGVAGVSMNTEFNLNVENKQNIKNTISLLGSLNKHLKYLKEEYILL